jgi:hypothetical protein
MAAITLPFVCPICGMKSWHPMDAQERYCAKCHRFVDEKPLPDVTPPAALPDPARSPRTRD